MRNKILICAVLLIALLLPMLSACGMGGLSYEDMDISTTLMDDGTTRVVITYLDDPENPIVLEIPKGLQGEAGAAGETGNGIKEIKLSNRENGERTMTIHYTNPDFPATEVTVKDGTMIESAERIDEEDGPKLHIKYSDGSEDKILLPKGDMGDPGVGVVNVFQEIDPQTNVTTVKFILSDGTEIGPIDILPGRDGMNLTNELVQEVVCDEITGDEIGVNVQFVLSDGTVTGKVYLPYGKNGVGIQNVQKEDLKDSHGKVIGVSFRLVKTDGSYTDKVDVLHGIGIDEVDYELLVDGKTRVNITLSNGQTKTVELPAAVSIKEVTQHRDDNGNTVLTIKMTDPAMEDIIVTLQEANGIDYIVSGESADGTSYQLTINYTNGTTQTVSFAKNSAWHNGTSKPTPSIGKKGDYYFDQWNSKIWFRNPDTDTWEEIVNFLSFNMDVNVKFCISREDGEVWKSDGSLTPEKIILMKVGQSFATSGRNIPIPEKEGYVFVGWYATREPNTAVNAPFTDMTVIPNIDTIVLYPVWRAA